LPRFGALFVLEGTAFRCFILEPVSVVPLVRLWGSIRTNIPNWVIMLSNDIIGIKNHLK